MPPQQSSSPPSGRGFSASPCVKLGLFAAGLSVPTGSAACSCPYPSTSRGLLRAILLLSIQPAPLLSRQLLSSLRGATPRCRSKSRSAANFFDRCFWRCGSASTAGAAGWDPAAPCPGCPGLSCSSQSSDLDSLATGSRLLREPLPGEFWLHVSILLKEVST